MTATDEALRLDKALINQALLINDTEQARTKLVRAAARATDLLKDALAALRAGDVHVTEEFIERSIRHLNGAEDKPLTVECIDPWCSACRPVTRT